MQPTNAIWSDKVSNVAQVGGIETSVLDNGLGRGVRIAWFNTGTGLRFKVVIDRAMDIADAFFNQYSIAWLSHPGVMAPQPFSNKGADWLRTFGGGLVTTCGLSHVGGDEKDEFGERGVHDLISNTPAEIISIIQPDPARGIYTMSITGIIKQSKIFGIGGYRHALGGKYIKRFRNNKEVSFHSTTNYGFRNNDLIGDGGISFVYAPLHFGSISLSTGSKYQMLTFMQNFATIFSRSNYIKNDLLTYNISNDIFI